MDLNFTRILPFLFLFGENKAAAPSPLEVLHSFSVPKYIEGNNEPYTGPNIPILDVDYWKDPNLNVEKVFVTTPRGRPGTPASLSTIVKGANNESLLSPYPSWAANSATCDGMVSAFRTQVDSCSRLWVIDSGIINVFSPEKQKLCPPKIWIYDLITDTLLNSFPVPEEMLRQETLLTGIAVDVRNNACAEAFAYVSDPGSFMIVVFSLAEQRYWYFRNRLLYPYPLDGSFRINGATYDLMDGVLGLALGAVVQGDRILYHNSYASKKENTVLASVLRNSSLAGDGSAAEQKFKVLEGSRSSQSTVEAYWQNAIYFQLLGENMLACWPVNTAYTKGNIRKLYKDDTLLQFVSGIKAIDGNLWVLSSTLQTYFTNSLNESIINYRVIRTSIDKLTRGRGCRRR